jgi:hypothetical protein
LVNLGPPCTPTLAESTVGEEEWRLATKKKDAPLVFKEERVAGPTSKFVRVGSKYRGHGD